MLFILISAINAGINFDGVDSHIYWPDDPAWGDYGSLNYNTPDSPYSFGFKINSWSASNGEKESMFVRDGFQGIALSKSSNTYSYTYYTFNDGAPQSYRVIHISTLLFRIFGLQKILILRMVQSH